MERYEDCGMTPQRPRIVDANRRTDRGRGVYRALSIGAATSVAGADTA